MLLYHDIIRIALPWLVFPCCLIKALAWSISASCCAKVHLWSVQVPFRVTQIFLSYAQFLLWCDLRAEMNPKPVGGIDDLVILTPLLF